MGQDHSILQIRLKFGNCPSAQALGVGTCNHPCPAQVGLERVTRLQAQVGLKGVFP